MSQEKYLNFIFQRIASPLRSFLVSSDSFSADTFYSSGNLRTMHLVCYRQVLIYTDIILKVRSSKLWREGRVKKSA